MLVEACNTLLYGSIFLTMHLFDFFLGHGIVNLFQKVFCKVTCFFKRTFIQDSKLVQIEIENPLNVPVLLTEILLLSFTVTMLNKYKKYRSKDRIDELLHESKAAVSEINEFLEKWRLRHINHQESTTGTECSYLDDEPQEITPLKLEVPILHMAIIDTLGTTRSQPERGDAGDTIYTIDSALFSVTSLLTSDDDDATADPSEELLDKTMDYNSRYLWDVMEEDANSLEEI